MATLELFALTPEGMGLGQVGAYARRVESLGFDGLFVSDGRHEALLLAAQALGATTRLRVGTSVLVAFPRSPMNAALSAWDLQELSAGRFELGLGTQIKQNIEDRFAARWLPPVAGMREYLESLRAIFRAFRTGEPLSYAGQHYRFARLQPFFNPGPIDAPDPQVMIGAVGPKMLGLAGEAADGLHTHPSSTAAAVVRDRILPAVAAGEALRPAGLPPPKICLNELVATGADEETVLRERQRYRQMLAFVFSTPAYWDSLDHFGWKDVGVELQRLTREGRWPDLAGHLPDEVLAEFLVTARYADLPEALAARFDGLADRISLPLPADARDDVHLAAALPGIRARCRPRGAQP